MHTTPVQIKVLSILNNDAALTPTNGDKLFLSIYDTLKQSQFLEIDFTGIRFITSAFLNASVGQLYAHFNSEFIKQHLKVSNLENDDLVLLARVVERAKEYFSDKANVEAAISKGLTN